MNILKIKVVAEGVETEEQPRLLRLLSCDEMQLFFQRSEMVEAKSTCPDCRWTSVYAADAWRSGVQDVQDFNGRSISSCLT